MSNVVRFIADLHFGHNGLTRILNEENLTHLRGNVTNMEEHDEWLLTQMNSVIDKRDVTYILGDACFNNKSVDLVKKINGTKILLRGNHDKVSHNHLTRAFNSVIGFQKKFGFWLSHCPIHPNSLRNRKNIHGHLHAGLVRLPDGTPDERYINVSVEQLNGIPISLDELKEKYNGES